MHYPQSSSALALDLSSKFFFEIFLCLLHVCVRVCVCVCAYPPNKRNTASFSRGIFIVSSVSFLLLTSPVPPGRHPTRCVLLSSPPSRPPIPRFLPLFGVNDHFSSSSGGEPYDLKVEGAGFQWVDGRYARQGRDLVDGAPYYTQQRRSRGNDAHGVGLMVSVLSVFFTLVSGRGILGCVSGRCPLTVDVNWVFTHVGRQIG